MMKGYRYTNIEIEGGWIQVNDGVLTIHASQFDDPLFLVAVHVLIRVTRLREVPTPKTDPMEELESDLEVAEMAELGLPQPANE